MAYPFPPFRDRPGITISAASLAKLCLFIYLFFLIFGTTVPFRESTVAPDDIRTNNPIKQFVFSALYLISFLSLLPKRRRVYQLIQSEKLLTLFLVWAFLTVLWSDYPVVSLKRWVQLAGTVVIFVAAFAHMGTVQQARSFLKLILAVYLPLTLLAVMLVPAAIQWEFPAWRGLATHKNVLGQIALISTIIWTGALVEEPRRKWWNGGFLLLSLIILLGSRSTTSFLAGCVILFLILAMSTGRLFGPPVATRFFLALSTAGAVTLLLSVAIFSPELIPEFFDLLGKDTSFSGRIGLWLAILDEALRHPLTGCGFNGYWVMNSPLLETVFAEFIWIPNQAHNGYLDMFNEVGLIGLGLFLAMMLYYFQHIFRQRQRHFWKWIVVAVLIINVQESTLFRVSHPGGAIFILAYLALYFDKLHHPNPDRYASG